MAESIWRVAIVVGASSGMGEQIARRLAAEGCRVALVARREAELERVAGGISEAADPRAPAFRVHDVTDYDAVPALWDSIETELGAVDVLVYSAGVMPVVGRNEFSFDKDRAMAEVNLLGAMAWMNQAAVRMQAARRGTIVAVSSVAGDRGRPGQPGYNASKAALSTFTEALYNRLWRHGVRVVDVRPGPVLTPMTEHMPDLRGALEADTAASLILRAARTGARVAYIPSRWRWIMLVIRWIPSFLFRRLWI